jgi:hypothetical protein
LKPDKIIECWEEVCNGRQFQLEFLLSSERLSCSPVAISLKLSIVSDGTESVHQHFLKLIASQSQRLSDSFKMVLLDRLQYLYSSGPPPEAKPFSKKISESYEIYQNCAQARRSLEEITRSLESAKLKSRVGTQEQQKVKKTSQASQGIRNKVTLSDVQEDIDDTVKIFQKLGLHRPNNFDSIKDCQAQLETKELECLVSFVKNIRYGGLRKWIALKYFGEQGSDESFTSEPLTTPSTSKLPTVAERSSFGVPISPLQATQSSDLSSSSLFKVIISDNVLRKLQDSVPDSESLASVEKCLTRLSEGYLDSNDHRIINSAEVGVVPIYEAQVEGGRILYEIALESRWDRDSSMQGDFQGRFLLAQSFRYKLMV